MSDEKIIIIKIDSEHMPETLPKGFTAFYVPSVHRSILVPEEIIEEFLEDFRNDENAIEKEAEPEDIIQFHECIKDSVPNRLQKVILFAPQEEDKISELRLQAVHVARPRLSHPTHTDVQQHFHSNKNFNARQNTRFKNANSKGYRR